jgi:hypothetical protein
MAEAPDVPETSGVEVQLLATVDLGQEIEGMEGRQLRMRLVTMAPGAVFGPLHDHVDRPGLVCILQAPSPTTGTVSPPSTAPAPAGPRTATPCTGWRTAATFLP